MTRKEITAKGQEHLENLEYHRKYRKENIEKRRKWNADWIKNNREKYNAQKAGINTYEKLRKEGFPVGIQILCANCNQIKEVARKRDVRLQNPFYQEIHANYTAT